MTRRGLLGVALALVVLVPASMAQASSGSPEAVASPYTRTDAAGDCSSGAGPGGARCDITKVKVVNRAASVKLVATYAGVPFLPTPEGTSKVGDLIWHLEGAQDFQVFVARAIDGVLYADVRNDPDLGGDPVCWSGNESMPAPVIDGQKVTVVVPRACLGDLTTVRVFAVTEKVKPPSAAVSTDRAPNTGFTSRVSMAA